MSAAKHTPGPWRISGESQSGGIPYIAIHPHRPWFPRERGSTTGNRPIAKVIGSKFVAKEERKANARLIAFAPDLLEALRELLAADDWVSAATLTDLARRDGEQASARMESAWDSARSAIAKATGSDT